jgi:hypothetical protein
MARQVQPESGSLLLNTRLSSGWSASAPWLTTAQPRLGQIDSLSLDSNPIAFGVGWLICAQQTKLNFCLQGERGI